MVILKILSMLLLSKVSITLKRQVQFLSYRKIVYFIFKMFFITSITALEQSIKIDVNFNQILT